MTKKRETILHQITSDLVMNYDTIVIEDLSVKDMIKSNTLNNANINRAIMNVGLWKFRDYLSYKGLFYGCNVVVADKYFKSTQTCSSCGHIQPMPLSNRQYICGGCGVSIDRDYNAALNLVSLV
jgi:putative transposase